MNELVDAAKVNRRKHRNAGWPSAVPKLGVTCPHFFRCESTAFLQLAIFQHLSLPRMDHFGSLPGTAKQIPNRLPVLHRESEGDSVLPSKENSLLSARFPRSPCARRSSSLAIGNSIPLQIQFLQQPSELRNPRVSNHRIPRGKGSGKLQTRGKFFPLPAPDRGGIRLLQTTAMAAEPQAQNLPRLSPQAPSLAGAFGERNSGRARTPSTGPSNASKVHRSASRYSGIVPHQEVIEIPQRRGSVCAAFERGSSASEWCVLLARRTSSFPTLRFLRFHLFVPWKSHQVYKVQSGILRFADEGKPQGMPPGSRPVTRRKSALCGIHKGLCSHRTVMGHHGPFRLRKRES